MGETINLDPYNKGMGNPIGLKCESCGFVGNDRQDHYCGKCGKPLQFFNRFPKWNNEGNYYELKPPLFYDRGPDPIEWEVVSKGSLENANRYHKLKELILKEGKEGNSIFRTKKQFLKELLSIIAE